MQQPQQVWQAIIYSITLYLLSYLKLSKQRVQIGRFRRRTYTLRSDVSFQFGNASCFLISNQSCSVDYAIYHSQMIGGGWKERFCFFFAFRLIVFKERRGNQGNHLFQYRESLTVESSRSLSLTTRRRGQQYSTTTRYREGLDRQVQKDL